MSHFTVLVITDARPSGDALGAILQPWHEFECTGIDDRYVQNIDRTEEAMAAWRAATVTRLKDPDGTLHSQFDSKGNWKPEFSQPDLERGGTRRKELIPAGFEKIEVPACDHETAADWITGYYGWPIVTLNSDPSEEDGKNEDPKYGFIELDAEGAVVRCIDRTNPNKKWDWWVIGGRWSGHLCMKPGKQVIRGRPGTLGAIANDFPQYGDQAQWCDVDIDDMRRVARSDFEHRWDEVHSVAGSLPPPQSWEAVRKTHNGDIATARDAYWAQPAIADLKQAFPNSWGLEHELRALAKSRSDYSDEGAAGALSTFAVVKDGKWYQRGEMGWFASVSDEKDVDAWNTEFAKLLDDLPPTAWLTVVDCHI